jgi:hypothetical protein
MKTILMTIGFVAAFGMIAFGAWNWSEARQRKRSQDSAMAYADQLVDRTNQNAAQVMAKLNEPPRPAEPRQVALRALVELRSKLETCSTTSEAFAAAYAIRDYAEKIRDNPPPAEIRDLMPGVMVGYDGQGYLDAHSEMKADEALTAFQGTVKRLAAQIDAAMPLLR